MFKYFQKMIVRKNKIPRDVKETLKTLGDTNCLGGFLQQISTNRVRWVQIIKMLFHVFDGHEIQIQAFVDFINVN